MGHQVNFYATPKDIAVLEQRLRNRLNLAVFLGESSTAAPAVVDSLNVDRNGRRVLRCYLAPPEDMAAVVMHYIRTQGYWSVEVDPSPVVELDGCYCDGPILRRGRAYYVDHFLDGNQKWWTKSEEFRKWAKTVLSIIKNTFKPLEPRTAIVKYIGEDAAAWHAAGGKLVD